MIMRIQYNILLFNITILPLILTIITVLTLSIAASNPHYVYLKHSTISMEQSGHYNNIDTDVNTVAIHSNNIIDSSTAAYDNDNDCINTDCQYLIHIDSSINSNNNNNDNNNNPLSIRSSMRFLPQYKIAESIYYTISNSKNNNNNNPNNKPIIWRLLLTKFHSINNIKLFINQLLLDYPLLNSNSDSDSAAIIVKFNIVSIRLILITITTNNNIDSINTILAILSTQNEIIYIEPKLTIKTLNSDANSLIQSGQPSIYNNNPTINTATIPITNTIHSAGLLGQNQLIAIGDSQLDTNSCFFVDYINNNTNTILPVNICTDCGWIDPDNDADPNDDDNTICQFTADSCISKNPNPQHRKIAAYWAYSGLNAPITEGEHGTHCAGSIAGKPHPAAVINDRVDQFSGLAPESRLIFTQLADITPLSESLLIPDDVYSDYFPWSYNQGARIFSNSWASDSDENSNSTDAGAIGYDSRSSDIDRFIYENSDMLVLFAAGNEGDSDPKSVQLTSEANSKNALIVGASQTSFAHFIGPVTIRQTAEVLQYLQESLIDKKFYNSKMEFSDAPTTTLFKYINEQLTVAREKFDNIQSMVDYYSRKITTDTDYPCKSLDINTSSNREYIGMSAFLELQPLGRGLSACLLDNYQLYAAANNTLNFNQNAIAEFSSYGPTNDNRIKPDIVAPGSTIISAKSHTRDRTTDQCTADLALLTMDGTSMATPVTAGTAALVRQYYTEGWHINGYPTPAHSINPSAALLKATLINSGKHLISRSLYDPSNDRRKNRRTKPFQPGTEDNFVGFGLIQLNNVLSISTEPSQQSNKIPLQLLAYQTCINSLEGLRTGSISEWLIELTDNRRPFTVTLVWTDPAASASASIALVNDLDLTILDPKGELYYGNWQHRTNGFPSDRLNNVERIRFDSPVLGKYRIQIIGFSVNIGNQPYALVATAAGFNSNKDSTTDAYCTAAAAAANSADNSNTKKWIAIWVSITIVAVLIIGYGLYRYCRYHSSTVTKPRGSVDLDDYFIQQRNPALTHGGSVNPALKQHLIRNQRLVPEYHHLDSDSIDIL